MNIKLIVMDMDGTFLTDDSQFNYETFQLLKENCANQDIRFVFCTGKQCERVETIVGDLATNTFIVGDSATRIKYNGDFIYNAVIENQKAKEIGIQDTIFGNPTGLDDYEENYSTAYDMALLSKYAYQNETYREIVGTEKYRVEGEKLYIWNNRNELLKTYDYATGGKTGYTPRAGHTLVTTASYNGLDFTAVTLNDGNMYLNQEELYDYAFSNYERITILDKDHFEVSDNYYQDKIYIKNSFQYPLTKEEQEEVTTLLSLTKKTKLKDGDEVGKVEVYLKGEKIHEEPVFVEIKKKRTFLDFLKDLF